MFKKQSEPKGSKRQLNMTDDFMEKNVEFGKENTFDQVNYAPGQNKKKQTPPSKSNNVEIGEEFHKRARGHSGNSAKIKEYTRNDANEGEK